MNVKNDESKNKKEKEDKPSKKLDLPEPFLPTEAKEQHKHHKPKEERYLKEEYIYMKVMH